MNNNKLYNEIIDELYSKFKDHKISKVELERIVDSQFRVMRNSIGKKDAEVTMLTYLGKVVPSKAHKEYVTNRRSKEESTGNI